MAITGVPVHRETFETTDVALAHDFIRRAYVDHRVELGRPGEDFRFCSAALVSGDLVLDELVYPGRALAATDPYPAVVAALVTCGRYEVRCRDRHHRLGAGGMMVMPTDGAAEVGFEDVEVLAVRLPVEVVARVAARTGIGAGDLRFEALEPVSPALSRYWARTARYLKELLGAPEPEAVEPLLHGAALDLAASAVLAVFPNTTMRITHRPGPGAAEPAAVRRAAAYLEAHAGEPITIEDAAEAAGMSVRGLQAAFQRHRDITPLGFLRRVRLERAHRDLQDADPARGDTVRAVARRWGFANPGAFAVEYRRTYGEPPSRTLRG